MGSITAWSKERQMALAPTENLVKKVARVMVRLDQSETCHCKHTIQAV